MEPLDSLSLAMHSSPGVYALLLGSGVSRSAGILTGWEITLDLVRKLAKSKGEDCGQSPEVWFATKFGKDPDYSGLLEEIAQTSTERSMLLRTYFEPNETEKGLGLKVPTEAHRSIARLAAGGFVKVIVTTNFDRLIETALVDADIPATVIDSPDAAEGAMPLVHSGCTVIKVHGDYLDGRIRNTKEELESYDPRVDALLDKVFDEYGLVVCGWSGEYDVALVSALRRSRNHRFSTYWTLRGEPSAAAAGVIQHRQARKLPIVDADNFSRDLADRVLALRDDGVVSDRSPQVAVATAKKFLEDPLGTIRLHDLVMSETEHVYEQILNNPSFACGAPKPTDDELRGRAARYESLVAVLRDIVIAGCHWGDSRHESNWVGALERLGNMPLPSQTGYTVWLNLRLLPCLILLYAGGLSATASEKYSTLAALLLKPRAFGRGSEGLLILELQAENVVSDDVANRLFPSQSGGWYVPVSEYLFSRLRDPFKVISPSEGSYERCFDRFEYLLALVVADLVAKLQNGRTWAPIGRFGYKHRDRFSGRDSTLIAAIDDEIASQGADWPALKAGLFGGSHERLKSAVASVKAVIKTLRWF